MTDARIGEVLAGKYRIDSLIGAGSMGLVYAAMHRRTHERVAIKFLRRELIGDDEHQQRFVREARAVAQLRHPNIVRLMDLDEDPEWGLYMVLELLEGETLEDLLQREGTLSLSQTLTVLRPVMLALERAHQHGVIHRDVKPANIYLHREAHGAVATKLLDFGLLRRLALQRSVITQSGQIMGTVEQMSPEQAWGSKTLTCTTDVWSMAVVLYRCLSGVYPFSQQTYEATLVAVAQGEFMPLDQRCPRLPRGSDLQRILARALSVDVSKRPASMLALMHELDALTTDSHAPHSESERAPAVQHERSSATRLAVLIGAVSLLGGGLWWSIRATPLLESRRTAAVSPVAQASPQDFDQPSAATTEPAPAPVVAVVDAGSAEPQPPPRPKRARAATNRTNRGARDALDIGEILVR